MTNILLNRIKTVKNVANVFKNQVLNEEIYYGTDYASEKENYQIAICQNGKFAVTFDTANLRIKILENTDHRPFTSSKKKVNSNNKNEFDGPEKLDEQDDINQIIAYFKINDDFMVEKFYEENYNPPSSGHDTTATENKASNLKWSFDISNVQEKNGESFIFVAISRIADEDMRRTSKEKRKDRKDDNKKPDYERKVLSKIRYNCPLPPDEAIAVDMQNTQPELTRVLTSRNNSEIKKGIAIYRLDLKKNQGEKINYIFSTVTYHYSDQISGICRFIEASSEDDSESLYDFKLKRFIILNYRGIYNFEFDDHFDFFTLNEKFEYPASIRRELDSWYVDDDCMKRLLSCIYDKYFLVTQYKNNAQSLEVYDLEKMELETTAKKLENKDKFVKRYNYDTFAVSRLQLCFTRGVNNIRLYYIENGLQVAKKKLEVDRIHLLEFIENDEKLLVIGEGPKEGKDPEGKKELKTMVWDLYDTGKVESIKLDIPMDIIKNLGTRLARTSGNILQIGDDGKVSSVLKKIEKELKKKKKNEKRVDKEKTDKITDSIKKLIVEKPDGEPDESHNIYYDQKYIKFKPIVDEKEPWVLGDYDRHSYCLYHNRKETEVETLQLIVGRSTVQIWHQIQDKKNKDDLPNKGEPFLEYIWTNRIPINQEREETKLRIKDFKYGSNVGLHEKLDDFHLKVYWYERKDNEENSKKEEHAKKKEREITKEAEDEISKIEDEIKRINEDGNMDETEKEKRRLEIINNSVKVKRKEKVIKLKYIIEKFHAVTHACRALEHLNKRYKNKRLANNYTRAHKYEEIITYVKHIVWRFAKNEPENFRLLDVRRNIMKSLILGDCDYLIKFILFGDDEEINENKIGCKEKEKEKRQKEDEIRYIPCNKLWPGKTFLREDDLDFDEKIDKLEDNETIVPENIMELAIYHCKGRELNDTIMIAYLLEFYSRHATDCAGWMCTVSKAIPLLFKYNYDDYARKLFFKECFAVQDHFSAQEPDEIIPTEYLARRNHDIKFRAFKPLVKLETDKYEVYVKIVNPIKNFKNIIFKIYENFDNDLGKSPLALRVVPLPGFTKNNIGKKKAEYGLLKIILNLFWIIFLPRWYQIGRHDRTKLSPFSRMILYENNDDIYDNPATEAVIDFLWRKAKIFFFLLFLRFIVFATCFGLVSWAYLNYSTIINGTFLFTLIIIFYYLAIYQIVTELIQFRYRGFKKYFGEIFNSFDIISLVLSVTVMSIMVKNFQFSDGFGSVKTIDNGLIAGISFSIFLLWIDLILYLRLISNIGIYIYYVIIIFKTIFPFFLFMSIVIFAFAHTMFVLLRNPANIKTKESTYSGNATNVTTNETLYVELKSDFDPKSSDNPFSTFSDSLIAAYFWMGGNWVQRDDFDFWAIDIFTFVASIFLVIVLQNMLIAFMSGIFERAEIKGRQTLLRHRANHIVDYEALHHIHLWNLEPEPKHIYYFGQSKTLEEWYATRKSEQGAIYKDFEEKSTFTKLTFKGRCYDKRSIWEYVDKNLKMEKINMKNYLNDIIEWLIKYHKDQNNEKEINIESINEIIKEVENMKLNDVKKIFL
ncbi:hypothetical protein RhiirA1_541575 [Rhizophagus irregularis]|uniref:Ion transport domain-containing protein n=1 Tax=Rhizophagus irregularis TaxID=588596 RepID=A0A2N0R2L6_9GLOM|nr:hypothetical protein RhiirA1_541575 [Rhizophagus irregularis]